MSAAHPAFASDRAFYAALPAFDRFAAIAESALYRSLPESWWIGVTDVAGSTAAIAEGRYKTVNMVGASAISAVMNALGQAPFPFVFGGDGATFAIWPDAHRAIADALARTVRWVAEEAGLTLRAALVPLAEIRAAGHDVRVARFQAAPDICYAMFAGGGVAWAINTMKAGRFAVSPAAPGEWPDLQGLSCRWTPIAARRGAIVSLIAEPREGVDLAAVAPALSRVLQLVAGLDREGHPVPANGPGFNWPPAGLELEARASRRGQRLWIARIKLVLVTLLAWVLDRTGWKLGGFDPLNYRRTTAANADYRKFDDGLRLTIDCDDTTRSQIEEVLREASAAGLLDYGLHAQPDALMTCIVPSALRNDHFHFVDGADGGYARAAESIKAAKGDQQPSRPS